MTRDHHAPPSLTLSRKRGREGRGTSRSILVRAALIAGCATLLAGCNSSSRTDIMAWAPSDYRQRHPIVVTEKERTVKLFVGAGRAQLTAEQRAEVLSFGRAWRREATGGIVINVPAGTRNAAAAAGAAHEARSMLTAVGVPPKAVVVRRYRVKDPRQLATVRLNYPRMAAEAGPCGLWPNDIGPTTKGYRLNKPYWNFGCASQRNLAAMVDNPADLVQPRSESPVYRMRRTFMLEQYRKGEDTSSKGSTDNAAAVSEVGR